MSKGMGAVLRTAALAGCLTVATSCAPESADLAGGTSLASLGSPVEPAAPRPDRRDLRPDRRDPRPDRRDPRSDRRDLEAELARLGEELAECRRTLEAERTELALLDAKRLTREREWLDYTRTIAALDLKSLPDSVRFDALALEDAAAPEPPETEDAGPEREDVGAERSREVLRTLRTLLILEEVRGIDLMDVGRVDDSWCGPVVFRLLDAGGRLSGTLCAERLRLEGSRAGKTLTLVLEDGFEAHAGVRTPFAGSDPASSLRGETVHGGGVRRIQLPRVDPLPWVESLSELFGEFDHETEFDDGEWNLALVLHSLNRLLLEDAAAGYYRLEALRGVSRGVLREVHLEHRNAEGALDRRVFADRLTIGATDRGVQLLLEDGVHVRGERKAPFLEGRYRIFLPRADVGSWRAAGVPGLAPPVDEVDPGETTEPDLPGENDLPRSESP